MTWRLRTSFNQPLSAIVGLWFAAAPAMPATVTGSVRLIDRPGADLRARRDQSGVVVWLEPAGGARPALNPKTLEMGQRKKHFEPPVLAISTGSSVTFPNFDPIFHNVFSNYSGKVFDVGLYPPGTVPKILFNRSGIVRVFCNIHPTMSAVIVVEDTPYLAVTGGDGSFRIDSVEPGEYRLQVFEEQAAEQTLSALKRTVTVDRDAVALPVIEISETGYVQVPHKNKYGKDYPAVIEDRPMYPSGKSVRR